MSHRHDHDHDHPDHDHDHDHDHSPAVARPIEPDGYWRSLRELAGGHAPSPEFPPGADQPPPRDPMSRRNFFHLMGASAGLAGLAAASGCRRYESEEIVPLARRPEDQVPGTTLQYTTAYDLGGSAHALIATSFEGRPIHLDGNPEHPFAGGPIVSGTKRHAGVHTFATGSLLHLYDPDRSQNPTNGGKGASLDQLKAALADVRKTIGGGMHVLAEATSSPTVQRLRRALQAKGVVWTEYEPLSWDNERLGTKRAFGKPVRPLAKLDKCETIVTIDCDLFVEHPAAMRYSRDFAKSRRKDGTLLNGKMNRLWSVESTFTNTGAMADHRLPLRSELGLPFVMALDAALGGGGETPDSEFLKEEKPAGFLKFLAAELRASTGRAVVLAGRRQPPEVHAYVAKINQAIGAVGATLDYLEDPDPDRPSHHDAIRALGAALDQPGRVQTLVILGGNPVYDAPADLDFAKKLANAGISIRLGEYEDETSKKATWHVPRAHFLEAWGDARTWDGTISIAQPLIAPLYGGLSSAEFLSLLLGDEKSGEELVKDTHRELGGGMWPWRQNVHDGFVPATQLPAAQVQLVGFQKPGLSDGQKAGSRRDNGQLEVTFHFSSSTYDGRFANNAWLWETPDFLTKVTWDNYALVSPDTAKALKVENDTLITVKIGDRSVELPCYTMPGQGRSSIALVLGGGRTEAGHVVTHPHNVDSSVPGKRVVGWDTYKVRTTNNASGYGFDIATGATVTTSGRKYELADVQDHWDYKPGPTKIFGYDKGGFDPEVERRSHEDVKETTNKDFEKNRNWKAGEESEFWDDAAVRGAEDKKPRGLSLFEEHTYNGHRWAMAIDLSTCTGCNACMVACQSENNVPVVGRREVINNREMHWIRIDRYFQGSPEDPRVVAQPLACQQCENAPCEQVCPVGATSHSDEGLNDMAYNRCIGTRYCLNNCPYKVRRFNFLDWNSEFREARAKVRRLLFNPDVTVRMRGVMEKCTYCVQRIQNAKIKWKAQHRVPVPGTAVDGNLADPMPDGTIETACQMACPTEAIVFGDLQDPESRVSKLHADRRAYDLLPDNYTKPRTKFIARLLNPNEDMQKVSGAAAPAAPKGER
ncbi:MAG TPA: Fe-S-cluster-containing hydrogenase [Kofleriaceae bacterium]|nr:Fe-S-cluster-containing hydrogenase [Kofleriaceae bacterium]